MALHAIDNVEDAFRVTREFLTPVELRKWLTLAVIVLFVGGGTNLPSISSNTQLPAGSDSVPTTSISLPEIDLLIVAGILTVVILGYLLLRFLSASMEFVFVESLRTEQVRIRRHWRWGRGARLFGFLLVVDGLSLAVVLGGLAVVLWPLLLGVLDPFVFLGVVLLSAPVLIVFGIFVGLLRSFTISFVVPIMLLEDCGVLAGWRRLWGTILPAWKQYLAYVLVSFLLTVALGLVVSLLLSLVGFVLIVPLGVAGIVTFLTLSTSPAGVGILVALGVAFGLVMLAGWAIVQVPVQTYLRYYALLVLGDIESAFDIVPEQREAVRE